MSIRAKFSVHLDEFHLDVDLDIPEYGVTAIFGESGCGKTTLLRAIAGLDHYDSGYLRVGEAIWQDETSFLPIHQRPLGYVFQEPSLFPHLTVSRNLDYGRDRVSVHQVDRGSVIELLGLEELLERQPSMLSGGEQQRVAIARALLTSPRLLLMDEPLASLDLTRKLEILPYIDRLHDELGTPVLYVSHDRDEVARLADHLLVMHEGRIVAEGDVAEMLTGGDSPLVRGAGAEAVFNGVVATVDPDYHLASLDSAVGPVVVNAASLELGQTVRIRVLARDVSITLNQQTDTSILNIFQATVDELIAEGPAQVTVRLRVGDTVLLARITRRSCDQLGLQTGMTVYAQTKSVAVLA